MRDEPGGEGAAGLMAARDFAPMFPIDPVEKDFRYVLETARRWRGRADLKFTRPSRFHHAPPVAWRSGQVPWRRFGCYWRAT